MSDDDRIPYLGSAKLHNVSPFGSEVTFQFDPRVNVLIGTNGTGKTAALKTVSGEGRSRFAQSTDKQSARVKRTMEPERVDFENTATVRVGPARAPLTPEMVLSDLRQLDVQGMVAKRLAWVSNIAFGAMALAWIYIGALAGASARSGTNPQWLQIETVNLLVPFVVFVISVILYRSALSPHRLTWLLNLLMGNRLLSEALSSEFQVSSIFMFQSVLAVNRRWLRPKARSDDDPRSRAANEAANLALDCAKRIAPEVFPATTSLETGKIKVPFNILWMKKTRSMDDPLSTVQTRYNPTPLHITDLSAGTQNTLLIAWYLALSLAYRNKFREDWKDLPAILFIDEIENHLHPAWQRRLIPVLLEHFPNLQIIATTHSPFPIAGLKAGQVHTLYQDDDGITRVETNEYDIVGYTADEILHRYLEMQDPTDLETAEAVEVLRWLQSLSPLLEEKSAETWRAAMVKELRALAADDEWRFEDDIAMRWLTGEIKSPLAAQTPLEGDAESWRQSMMGSFESLVGVDILSGGTVARQRKTLEEQILNGTFPKHKNFQGDEGSEA
ncbi:MAG: ATP-binding protein [Chloroflexi bacterium]|nr:ATP-binding protein [Chloroflexota bacterium]